MGHLDTQYSAFKYLIDLLGPYSFYYAFNEHRAAIDADYWTSAGDNGGFAPVFGQDEKASWKLYADTNANDDWYIIAAGNKARIWTPQNSEYSTVTMKLYLQMNTIVNTQALFGFVDADPAQFFTDYAEPACDSAIFFVDDGIRANFSCRTRDAAEEETDSGVAMAIDTHHLFVIDWTTTSTIFKIDGTTVATHETQVPAVPMIPMLLVRTQIIAEEKGLEIEYVKVEVE